MTVGEICSRDVVVTRPNLPLAEAAALLSTRGATELLVVREPEGERVPIGIVTDHDLATVRRWSRTPHVTVADVMRVEFVTAGSGDDVGEALAKMHTFALRALPVVNACGGLEGIITLELASEAVPPETRGSV
jgi:CBS domain-containing protein